MRFTSSFALLAALSSGAVARHGHHVRHEGHMRRQVEVDSTTTVTTTNTVTYCPCEESTSSTSTTPSYTPVATPSSIELTTSLELATETPVFTPSTTSTPVLVPTTTEEPTTTSTPVVVPTTSEEPSSTYTPTSSSSTSSVASSSSTSSGASADWSSVPSSGEYSTSGFGSVTKSSGSGVSYTGNVGNPYGSNIISVEGSAASEYQYVVEFTGSNTDDWKVVIWNKIGEDGKMDGWYGNACHEFTIAAGETKYYAFASDSQGGWAAAKGSTIPTDSSGGYASTWGEFDFGSTTNSGWSGFDVSAIQAQNADLTVQGMKICSVHEDSTCSSITSGAATVSNAYTSDLAKEDGIGGNLNIDAVRLAVTLDYSG